MFSNRFDVLLFEEEENLKKIEKQKRLNAKKKLQEAENNSKKRSVSVGKKNVQGKRNDEEFID
jgi:hypothetical protein